MLAPPADPGWHGAPRPREPAVAAGAIRPAACPPPGPRPPPVVRQRARWPPPARARLVRHVRAPPRPWPGPLPAPARRRQNGATPASTGFSSCPAPDPYAAALFHRGRGPLQCRVVPFPALRRACRNTRGAPTRVAQATLRQGLRPTRGQGAAPDLFPHAAAVFLDFKIQLQARVRRQPRGRHKSGRRAKPDLRNAADGTPRPRLPSAPPIARRPPFPTAKPVQATHADQQGRAAARTANV